MRARIAQLAEICALLAGVGLFAIVAVTTTNVGAFSADRVARLWGETVSGLPGYEDFVRLAISSAALMLFPYCQLRRGHIAVDLFVKLLPVGARMMLDRIWTAIIAVLAMGLAGYMTLGMLEALDDRALSRVLGWPVWPFYLPGIASLILWAAVALSQVTEPRDVRG